MANVMQKAKRLGLTQNIIAAQFNISRNTVKRWFAHGVPPTWAVQALNDLLTDIECGFLPGEGSFQFEDYPFIRRDGELPEDRRGGYSHPA